MVSACYIRIYNDDCFYVSFIITARIVSLEKNLENGDFFFFNIQSITDDIIIIAYRYHSLFEVTKRKYCWSFKIK
jgi:hypothetical protein